VNALLRLSAPDALPWSKAATPVWALVSGLPTRKRQKRQLLMLQAYFDDSRLEPSNLTFGAYVVSGYLADATKWAAFSDAWQRVLDIASPRGLPKLNYLKTTQAFRNRDRASQFYDWTDAERNERLLLFAKTVNQYALISVQTIIPVEIYKRVLGPITKQSAYWLAFHSLIAELAEFLIARNIDDKVEIYFDRQGDESEDRIRESYREVAKQVPAASAAKIAGTPDFRDDKDVLPLQAADLIAWHVRRNIMETARHKELKSDTWTELLNLERLTGVYTEERMRRIFQMGNAPKPSVILRDPSSGGSRP
jgi:hypothetical protein